METILTPYLQNISKFIKYEFSYNWMQQNVERGDRGVSSVTSAEKVEMMNKITDDLRRLAPFYKHEGFQEEAEWRLVNTSSISLRRKVVEPNPVRYRSRGPIIIPFVELELADGVFDYVHTVVGPSKSFREAIWSTEHFLMSIASLDYVSVEVSKIPFRADQI